LLFPEEKRILIHLLLTHIRTCMQYPSHGKQIRKHLPHHHARTYRVRRLSVPWVPVEFEFVRSAVFLFGLETFGVGAFYYGAQTVDFGLCEGEEADAVAAVEGEGGEGCAKGCVCWCEKGGCRLLGTLLWRSGLLVGVLRIHCEVAECEVRGFSLMTSMGLGLRNCCSSSKFLVRCI